MRGLTEELVREISARKNEPKWMLDLRLQGVKYWYKLDMPKWAPDISEVDLDNIEMYINPQVETVDSWDKVPADIRETFDKLGIPEAEKDRLAGVGAQYDSEVVYHNLKESVAELGVVYLPMEEAVALSAKENEKYKKEFGIDIKKMVREHFMKLVPVNDHKFAALHAAVYSGGSFIYVPKGASVEVPLQSYYRLNAPGAGQFEHTLIIVDDEAALHFIEGCSAPKYNVANLHAGCVEVYVGKHAHMKFSTVESWSKNMYNLNTKRATVDEGGAMEWVTGSFGSRVSMMYPTTILAGRGAKMEYNGVTFAGATQDLDTGSKAIHLAPETSSVMGQKSISKDGGKSMTRTMSYIAPEAVNSKTFINCKSLILSPNSTADAVPELKVHCKDAEASHEASVGKVSEDIIQYLMSRGISEDTAVAMVVRGFTSDISKELPIEYAMEMNNLIRLEMENG